MNNPAISRIELRATELIAAGADADDVLDALLAVAVALGAVLDRRERVSHFYDENIAAGRRLQAAEIEFESAPPRGAA